jgi:ubiquinone/menaquinone biosynthesis C-methylase UbiE
MKTSRSDIEWLVYGELDYGASHDFPRGFEEWSLLKRHLRQSGMTNMSVCAELGCGCGRLTAALASEFETVHALDVSVHRLAQAYEAVTSSNVSFHELREPVIPLPDAVCDLCISTHVLQHIANRRVINAYLGEMRRVLRPGGFLLIHVPVIGAHGMTGELTEVIRRRAKEMLKGLALAVTRQLMRAGFRHLPWKVDQYRVFSFVQLSAHLHQIGFEEIELRVLPWAGGHGYVFAKALSMKINDRFGVVSTDVQL